MATKRTLRTRNRKAQPLTPAEIQWLTGEPQAEANKFTLLMLNNFPMSASRTDNAEALLDRAEGVISLERMAELRQQVQAANERHSEMAAGRDRSIRRQSQGPARKSCCHISPEKSFVRAD